MQKRGTKLPRALRSLTYPKRFNFLKLPTLGGRRKHSNLFETFKILLSDRYIYIYIYIYIYVCVCVLEPVTALYVHNQNIQLR